MDLLRLLTCGSVDDGKSTLIGRLLHDSQLIYEDVLAGLAADSATHGSAGDQVDLALLMDGLRAEREQGITIDVAYRYFSTDRRTFIIADTPGHPQYTRNMATGASTCDLAVILIDARHGVLPQTKRHSHIASLLGIRRVVVAVNKMDLIGWSQDRFTEICESYRSFAKALGFGEPYFLPMSALLGDNVVNASDNLGWFDGPPLLEHLETVSIDSGIDTVHFRMPVQLVSRPDADFRGYAGTIASGTLRPGDEVVALPSGLSSAVERIATFDGDLDLAGPGRAVTVTLADDIDISRGDLLVTPGGEPQRAHDLDAMVVWMAEAGAEPGSSYLLQAANAVSNCTIRSIRHRIDIDSGAHEQAPGLGLNDIGHCVITSDRELAFDPYNANRATGSFVLVERLTNATVAAGMIIGAASAWGRTPDAALVRQRSEISDAERAIRFGQQPCTILLTGLTAAGKSTLATALERELFDRGKVSIRLDGENVRMGISRDLGFSTQERSENLRRVSEVARLANGQGLIAIAALVAPDRVVRQRARGLVGAERYVEVFVDTPIEVCRERDPHGLYAMADQGEIPRFPGVSARYDRPTDADLRVDTSAQSVDECVEAILRMLTERGFLRGPSTP
ncbi:sulfate adenylyltransferase subunit CysN [Candidatus Poriferisodalis multihospitum]|uniref:sulfate adenylyltransferase subunit CysN n=1 Tax=Candidatus Poriferisodalis multihospitum TaxID=2983191 RepID=UPI0023940E52|nr:sulfate adenylyltransferase subunit CysN [Candidatus Poriferisodalis multihospitum]MDE0318962.1 sulfate adenylyltransferase subunit CysN [Acidimicrobiaceae bacterium]